MTKIRATYSGLIGLATGLITVFTGLIFILIVTRSLTPEELGTWGLIGGLVTYVIILEPMISYWSTREIARGTESAKTAVFSSTIFSFVGILAFLLIAFLVSEPTDTSTDILFFAAIMIPFSFLNRTLSAISIGWKPQMNSYGLLIFDISKISAAIIFVYYMELGVYGAILSLVIAHIPSIIFLAIASKSKLKNSFNKKFLKNWLKRAWLPSYIKSTNIVVLDILVFSLITGSVVGLAYWVAATTIGTAVRHSGQITRAVYPALLSGGPREHLQENLMKLFLFLFPFMALSLAFAKPALFIINPIYDVAATVVVFITIRTVLKIIGSALSSSLQGIASVDTKESGYKEYLKSDLFYLPTLRLIRKGVYLGSLAIGLLILVQTDTPLMDMLVFWSVIATLTQIPFTLYFYYLVRKQFPLSLDIVTIMKYLVISIVVFGGVYLLMDEYLEYEIEVLKFIPNLIPYLILGISVYFGLTYLTDKATRQLFNSIILEIKRKK